MATTTAPRKKTPAHTGFRNGDLFCFNCGGKQVMPMPMEVSMFSAMAKQFEKNHKACPKRWTPPEPDMSKTMNQRISWWLTEGEHGTSSMWMLHAITGHGKREYGHPHDPDDFRRCYLVLKAVPELREDFAKLAATSATWKNLVDNWDQLTAMLEEQMFTRKANGMYELMKTLGC